MAKNFPISLDVYTTLIDNEDDVLAAHANDRGDAIEAIEAKVGINGSAVSTSHDYMLSKRVVQIVHAQIQTPGSGSTALPRDTSIPQQGEGNEVITATITPTSATNELLIKISVCGNHGQPGGSAWAAALFQDSIADALAVAEASGGASQSMIDVVNFPYDMIAGTTSAITFKVRIGLSSGTIYWNQAAGEAYYGGKLISSITIFEYKP